MFKRIVLTACVLVNWPAIAQAGAFAFHLPVQLMPANGRVDAVAVGDFNGDGRDDIVALASGQLQVFLQRSDGSLDPMVGLAMTGTTFNDVRTADFGANGTDELLVGHSHGLAVYSWNGVGGFSLDDHPASYPCRDIATADVDSDGAPDVLCLGDNADAMLYSSNAVAVLSAPRYLRVASADGEAKLEDVTGDGMPDLLLASGMANSFFVSSNDGAGGFLPAVAYPYPEEAYLWPSAIAAMDVDGDGSNEILVASPCNRPCSNVYIYRRGTQGYFSLANRLPTYDSPADLVVADVDGDGRKDLLVAHAGWSAVGRYMGRDHDLSPMELRSFATVSPGGSGLLAVGDLNHDGYADLAVANTQGGSILYGGRQAANDFDGDFVSDLLWRHGTGANAIWLSADNGTPQRIEAADPAWSIQATGDFDGDGKSEMMWRNRETGANGIWSDWSQTLITGVTRQEWQVVGAGDFDGDQRADLFWRNARTGANTIWKSGDSTTVQATSGVTDLRWKVAGVGDFDGDGRFDVLWRHSTTGANVIWRGGQRNEQRAIHGVTDQAWQVVGVGDFNDDGNDDVVWRNRSTGANAIWRSAEMATTQGVTGVSNLAWTIVAVGDYNGDGRSDLMWRNTTTGAGVIWRSGDSRRQQSVATVRDLRWKIVP